MIRINLLTQKKRTERTAEGSQVWLAVVLVVVLAEVAMLFVYHSIKAEDLSDQQRKNAELSSQIEQAKRNVANHEEVKTQLAQLRAREEAVRAEEREALQTGRPAAPGETAPGDGNTPQEGR